MKTFNTQVCTTKEQSQRLLELGLKKETADMVYTNASLPYNKDVFNVVCKEYAQLNKEVNYEISLFSFIPAWSLHRLMELCPTSIHLDNYADTYYYLITTPTKVLYQKNDNTWLNICDKGNIYDQIIDMIKWLIKNKHFNNEYLEE